MEFGFVSIVLLFIATCFVLLGFKLLLATGWFVNFLRGFAGFGLLLLAFIVVMVGLNLASYAQLDEGQDIATVSFTKVDEQSYEASIVSVHGGIESKATVSGDMFQVNSRVLNLIGISTPFYKVENIIGRYYSLEQQRNSPQGLQTLPDTGIGIDLWTWFKGKSVGVVSTSLQKSGFLPMVDGAVFSVSIDQFGLKSTPVNDAARNSNNEWQ
jgi:hypothetical protein